MISKVQILKIKLKFWVKKSQFYDKELNYKLLKSTLWDKSDFWEEVVAFWEKKKTQNFEFNFQNSEIKNIQIWDKMSKCWGFKSKTMSQKNQISSLQIHILRKKWNF